MSHWGTEQVASEKPQLTAPTQILGQGYLSVREPGVQIHVHSIPEGHPYTQALALELWDWASCLLGTGLAPVHL